jgi:hypothetical protein
VKNVKTSTHTAVKLSKLKLNIPVKTLGQEHNTVGYHQKNKSNPNRLA